MVVVVQAPVGSTLSATSAEKMVQAARTLASTLCSDVNARVLTYDAAEAVQVLFLCSIQVAFHACTLCRGPLRWEL